MSQARMDVERGLRAALLGIGVNAVLALGKIAAGVLGHAYALIADGIESTADIFSSLIVWGGIRWASKPPDAEHPYGHGKAESIAGLVVAFMLLGAAVLISVQSVEEIRTPHHAPKPFTLAVLVLVVLVKIWLSRRVRATGSELGSYSLEADAAHHHSDALTSAAAFVGISIALLGGKGYESADDWGALIACGVITWNALRLIRGALDEIMDVSAPAEVLEKVQEIAGGTRGVAEIEKCRVRKMGLHRSMDIHVRVDGSLSVREGHEIAHRVKDRLIESGHGITDVTVHIEPANPDRAAD